MRSAEAGWLKNAEGAGIWALVRSAWLALPALAFALKWPHYAAWGVAPFFVGLAFPPLYYWATNRMRLISYWRKGLTAEELDRTDRFFLPWACAQSSLSSEEEQVVFRLWLERQAMGMSLRQRLWFRPRLRVFVSYSWHTAAEVELATKIAKSLHENGVRVFLDKRDIGRFGAWRARISDAILECTHAVVVVGAGTTEARIFPREIKMAVPTLVHGDLSLVHMCGRSATGPRAYG